MVHHLVATSEAAKVFAEYINIQLGGELPCDETLTGSRCFTIVIVTAKEVAEKGGALALLPWPEAVSHVQQPDVDRGSSEDV